MKRLAVPSLTDFPAISCERFRAEVFDLDRIAEYAVAPYASTEAHYQHVLVVSDRVDGPTIVLKRGARTAKRCNLMCLVVPRLEDLTVELAAMLTAMHCDWFGVRTLADKCEVGSLGPRGLRLTVGRRRA
jgi:hypothetical protein